VEKIGVIARRNGEKRSRCENCRFLLNICELLHENLIVTDKSGEVFFRDFLRDERKMGALFQKFVMNFFKREQTSYRVTADQLFLEGYTALW
jgi:5-methylcytosine-specific restriction endonuclease McrBC regulatory subunit McrC